MIHGHWIVKWYAARFTLYVHIWLGLCILHVVCRGVHLSLYVLTCVKIKVGNSPYVLTMDNCAVTLVSKFVTLLVLAPRCFVSSDPPDPRRFVGLLHLSTGVQVHTS